MNPPNKPVDPNSMMIRFYLDVVTQPVTPKEPEIKDLSKAQDLLKKFMLNK